MTPRAETRFERLARRGPSNVATRRTMVTDLAAMVDDLLAASRVERWPSARYAADPVRYCEEVLGFEPWSRQVEILEALRDRGNVAVTSGRKTGKSRIAAAAALHFYGTVEGGRVFLHMPRAGQIERILWPEISLLHRRSGRCLDCRLRDPDGPRPCPHSTPLDGNLSVRASTGLRDAASGRFIIGSASRDLEAVSGDSGPQLHIFDESAGIEDAVFDAVDGNSLGGDVKFLYLGNPTRNKGRYFEVFHDEKKRAKFHTVSVSSEEASEARDRQGKRFGHLATPAKIDEYRELWGEDSPLYLVHVKGQFAIGEDGSAFSVERIAEAVARWADDPGEGLLFIGCDPAGASGLGDETAFAIRRGTKVLSIETHRGMNEDAHLREIIRLVELHRHEREVPVVVVDREGSIGSVLHSRLLEYLDHFRLGQRKPFTYVPVKASSRAERMPGTYPRVRDELIANLEQWLRAGSIPDDDKLSKELNSVCWEEQVDYRVKATPKDELRRLLERSPDRMDALALCVWDSASLRYQPGDVLPPSAQALVDRDRKALEAARTPAGGGWEGGGEWDNGGVSEDGGRRRGDAHRAFREQRRGGRG